MVQADSILTGFLQINLILFPHMRRFLHTNPYLEFHVLPLRKKPCSGMKKLFNLIKYSPDIPILWMNRQKCRVGNLDLHMTMAKKSIHINHHCISGFWVDPQRGLNFIGNRCINTTSNTIKFQLLPSKFPASAFLFFS